MSLFADDITLYTENPKDATKKTISTDKWISEVAGYKINIQKLVAFIYTNNELSETKTKTTISFQPHKIIK